MYGMKAIGIIPGPAGPGYAGAGNPAAVDTGGSAGIGGKCRPAVAGGIDRLRLFYVYITCLPKGIRDNSTSLRCCLANGIPMIVIPRSTANTR